MFYKRKCKPSEGKESSAASQRSNSRSKSKGHANSRTGSGKRTFPYKPLEGSFEKVKKTTRMIPKSSQGIRQSESNDYDTRVYVS